MEQYANNSGDSAVSRYQIGNVYIQVEFTSGSIYEYTYSSARAGNIEIMKSFARSGSGLDSFINTHVKYKYSRKLN